MSYSKRPAREPSFPRRPSVYDIPGRGMRGYGDDASDFTVSNIPTTSDTLNDPGIASAAQAVVAAACANAGGTMDASGTCIPQADTPTPVQPSGGGGGGSIPSGLVITPAPAKASLASALTSGPVPFVIGGLVLVGLLAYAAKTKKTGADARS